MLRSMTHTSTLIGLSQAFNSLERIERVYPEIDGADMNVSDAETVYSVPRLPPPLKAFNLRPAKPDESGKSKGSLAAPLVGDDERMKQQLVQVCPRLRSSKRMFACMHTYSAATHSCSMGNALCKPAPVAYASSLWDLNRAAYQGPSHIPSAGVRDAARE